MNFPYLFGQIHECVIIYTKIKAMVKVAKCVDCKLQILYCIDWNSKERKGKYNVPLF